LTPSGGLSPGFQTQFYPSMTNLESLLGPRDVGLSRGLDGHQSRSSIPRRLTPAGHEFAEGLENPNAFETVRKNIVATSGATNKDVVAGVIKAEIQQTRRFALVRE